MQETSTSTADYQSLNEMLGTRTTSVAEPDKSHRESTFAHLIKRFSISQFKIPLWILHRLLVGTQKLASTIIPIEFNLVFLIYASALPPLTLLLWLNLSALMAGAVIGGLIETLVHFNYLSHRTSAIWNGLIEAMEKFVNTLNLGETLIQKGNNLVKNIIFGFLGLLVALPSFIKEKIKILNVSKRFPKIAHIGLASIQGAGTASTLALLRLNLDPNPITLKEVPSLVQPWMITGFILNMFIQIILEFDWIPKLAQKIYTGNFTQQTYQKLQTNVFIIAEMFREFCDAFAFTANMVGNVIAISKHENLLNAGQYLVVMGSAVYAGSTRAYDEIKKIKQPPLSEELQNLTPTASPV